MLHLQFHLKRQDCASFLGVLIPWCREFNREVSILDRDFCAFCPKPSNWTMEAGNRAGNPGNFPLIYSDTLAYEPIGPLRASAVGNWQGILALTVEVAFVGRFE